MDLHRFVSIYMRYLCVYMRFDVLICVYMCLYVFLTVLHVFGVHFLSLVFLQHSIKSIRGAFLDLFDFGI